MVASNIAQLVELLVAGDKSESSGKRQVPEDASRGSGNGRVAPASSCREQLSMFMHFASHELRGNLNSALTWLQLMELDDTPDTRAKGFKILAKTIEAQRRLIEDLVTAVDSPMNDQNEEVVQVNLPIVVDQLVAAMGKSVQVHEPTETCLALAKEGEVYRAIHQLLAYCAKRADDPVEITFHHHAEQVGLRIFGSARDADLDQITAAMQPFWETGILHPKPSLTLCIAHQQVRSSGGTIAVSHNRHEDGHDIGLQFDMQWPASPREGSSQPGTAASSTAG
jgi:hypothetical protein